MHSVWLDPLAGPEGTGAVPAHHLPLLDAFSAGDRALYRSRRAKSHNDRDKVVRRDVGVQEGEERGRGRRNLGQKSTKKSAMSLLNQTDLQSL